MQSVVLIIHLFLALAIIGLVLLQRSEGGGLGIGGGGGGMGALASAQSTANILTRATAICTACFFATSLILGILAGASSQQTSIMDKLENTSAVSAPADVAKDGEKAMEEKGDASKAVPSAPVSE